MYKPNPVNTSHIVLSDDLLELTEKIAENVHEVWAEGRIQEGWIYGPVRDDAKKETPCLVPYKDLPENEKDFDRNTAMATIKLIMKLGYNIERTAASLESDVALASRHMEMAKKIIEVYGIFGIKIGPLIGVASGEKTTRFDFMVDSDALLPKIRKLRDDVSLFLAVPPAELTCPIPGKLAFGIEIPIDK